MPSMLSIGVSGLNAAQANLATAGHNISNVNTPGFSRQRVEQSTQVPQGGSGGYFGRGTTIETVRRMYSEVLATQTRDAQSQVAASESMAVDLARLANLVGDETTGVSPSLARFFSAMQDLAGNPGDIATRQLVLASAQSLLTRLTEVDGQMNQMRVDANATISSSVGLINAMTTQLTELNDQITLAQATGQPPNDLLDRRDQLLRDLGQQVRVSVVRQTDGAVSVFLGSGQTLVSGNTRFQLSVGADPVAPQNVRLLLSNSSAQVPISSTALGGGQLAAAFQFRDGTLVNTQNSLGRVAQVFATQMNRQNALGADRTGAMGGAIFNVGTPTVIPNGANAGTGTLTAAITNESQLQASDYRLRFDGGVNYSITRQRDGVAQTFVAGAFPVTVDGVRFTIGGAYVLGDSILVQPVRTAVANLSLAITDPARLAASNPVIATAVLANLGNGRVSGPTVNGPNPNINLQQPVTIAFTGAATFDVVGIGTGNPVGVAYTNGGNITYNGWTVQISGSPRAGDVFTLTPNVGGSGSNTNAVAMAGLQSALGVNGATLAGAYGQMVTDVGADTRGAQIQLDAHQNIMTAADNAQQSLSGVNLDEEAANLVRYQQAYQAAARYISIASSLFDDLLQIGR